MIANPIKALGHFIEKRGHCRRPLSVKLNAVNRVESRTIELGDDRFNCLGPTLLHVGYLR